MIAHSVLQELVLVMTVSLGAVLLFRRLRIPSIVGFMAAGLLIGPGLLGLVQDEEHIEAFAEVGVILLLFAVGLRLSLQDLWRLRGSVFGAGGLQVLITAAVTAAALVGLGIDIGVAVVTGYVVALSSTALVVRLLEERGEADSAHGRWMLGVLLLQDIAVVPMLFSLPFLAHRDDGSVVDLLWALGEASLLVGGVIVLTRFLFPALARLTVLAGSREAFTLMVAVVVFGIGLVSAAAGLSMALGAFLAGVVISESEYCHQIIAEITPLRDVFAGLFFVSIGMLVDVPAWTSSPATLVPAATAIVVVKLLVVTVLAALFARSLRFTLLAAAGLAHAGEFSFVVASAALKGGVLDSEGYRLLLSAAVPTMLVMPFMVKAAAWVTERRSERVIDSMLDAAQPVGSISGHGEGPAATSLAEHVIVVGYGLSGRNVARILRLLRIPLLVVEMNPATVRRLRDEGTPVLRGDATHPEVLERAGVRAARAVVVAVADAAGARTIVGLSRRMAPKATVIVRTRYVREVPELRRLGADEVIPEEFETSLEMAGRVLATYGVSGGRIAREKAVLRDEEYRVLREDKDSRVAGPALRAVLARVALDEVAVPEGTPARTLKELDMRRRTGVTVLAVLRERRLTGNPPPDFSIQGGDLLVVAGSARDIQAARRLLQEAGSSPAPAVTVPNPDNPAPPDRRGNGLHEPRE